MMSLLRSPVLQACVFAAVLAYVLTWLVRIVAPRIGLCDKPDGERKLHAKPTPLMGGLAVYMAVIVVVGVGWLFGAESIDRSQQSASTWLALLASAGLTCLVGLWDDKFSMQARQKSCWQILACIPFVVWGPAVESVSFASMELQLGAGGAVFTVLWLFCCSTVINLTDGLDGLAGTIGLIASVSLAVLSALVGQYTVMLVSMVVAGSLIGFLVHNWPPAKIFMGDAGSLTIGFLIGGLSILSSTKGATGFTLIVPLVLISLPIFDTSTAIIRRTLTGKGICSGDRGHIHHRLQERGLTRLQALMTLAAICVMMAIVAIVSARLESDVIGAVACLSILAALIAGRVFGHHETSLLIRHFRTAGIVIVDGFRAMSFGFTTARLSGIGANQWREYWDRSRLRVAESGAHSLELTCSDVRNGQTLMKLCWGERDVRTQPNDNRWLFRYSIQRDDGVHATLTVVGDSSSQPPGRRLGDLFPLFDSICRHWPIDDTETSAGDDIRFPSIRPHESSDLPPSASTADDAQKRRAA